MSTSVANLSFTDPVFSEESLLDQQGVYLVLDRRSDGGLYVLDVGESAMVRTRIKGHDRRSCWEGHAVGVIAYIAYYTRGWSESRRRTLESSLRRKFDPPCGDR